MSTLHTKYMLIILKFIFVSAAAPPPDPRLISFGFITDKLRMPQIMPSCLSKTAFPIVFPKPLYSSCSSLFQLLMSKSLELSLTPLFFSHLKINASENLLILHIKYIQNAAIFSRYKATIFVSLIWIIAIAPLLYPHLLLTSYTLLSIHKNYPV